MVVAICGSVAAHKGAELVRELRRRGSDVRVILTPSGGQFIRPRALEALSGHPVASALFPRGQAGPDHIELAGWAEVAVVAPATAHLMATMATGSAPGFLGAWLLAFPGPVLLAPAMNRWMWAHPAVQRNAATLRGDGYDFVGPVYGDLAQTAEGLGWGRMAEPGVIADALAAIAAHPRWRNLPPPPEDGILQGRHVLVTAGPTREAIDPVRFLSNHSSGRMGYAVAEVAAAMGATVTLVSGPVSLPPPPRVQVVGVVTTEEMAQAVEQAFDHSDLVVAAGAPADWRPREVAARKLKKGDLGTSWSLELMPTTDILAGLGPRKGHRILVGFAAEAGGGIASARQKMASKHLDLIAFNDVTEAGAGFGGGTNHVWLLDPGGGSEEIGPTDKRAVAARILERAAFLLPSGKE